MLIGEEDVPVCECPEGRGVSRAKRMHRNIRVNVLKEGRVETEPGICRARVIVIGRAKRMHRNIRVSGDRRACRNGARDM